MRIPITSVGDYGMLADPSPHELPLGAFSFVRNMRVQDGALESARGYIGAFSPPSVAPIFLMPYPGISQYAWIYASAALVYEYQGGTHYDITRQTAGVNVPYTGASWNGTVINGIPVLNNGVDVPQVWNPPSPAQRLVALPNWTAGNTAAVVRGFKNHLVALDITKGATRYPHLVHWSHPADPGSVPVSWDITDPTHDAGEQPLAETGGKLVDCLAMRDTNVIYKEDAIYAMRYVGGVSVFDFKLVSREAGMLTANACASFNYRGIKHCVLTAGDLVVFDGNTVESILTKRMKKWLFGTINSIDLSRTVVRANPEKSEIWVCFCSDGSSRLETALVWNWVDNTFTVQNLPELLTLESGVVFESAGTVDQWGGDAQTWNSGGLAWGDKYYNPGSIRLLGASDLPTANWFMLDQSGSANGAAFECVAERQGITVIGTDRVTGKPIEDGEVVKLLTAIWPRIQAQGPCTIEVYVGTQMQRDEPVTWHGPYNFDPSVDRKVNPLVSGKILSVRFRSLGTTPWRLFGYDLELGSLGHY